MDESHKNISEKVQSIWGFVHNIVEWQNRTHAAMLGQGFDDDDDVG